MSKFRQRVDPPALSLHQMHDGKHIADMSPQPKGKINDFTEGKCIQVATLNGV